MAVVYEVTDVESGRPLAVKVLLGRGAGSPRFSREYLALARIDHPNVLRVYGYGVTESGLPYLVMELLHGVAAQVRVKSLGRPGQAVRTSEALRIAFHVAGALQCLHRRGIIHRDLKSSNVIVLSDGRVKLLDFGTVRVEDLQDLITEPGEFVGTYHYASPEQLTGGTVDARSDLYALGVLLFRMLCGRRPFEGDDPSSIARLHLECEPASVDQIVRGVPEPVVELVARLLAKSPSNRPQDAAAVVDFLRPFVVAPPAASDPVAPLRFLGRHGHQAAIRKLFDDAIPGAGLIFCGPEGAGRGRLIGYAVDEATRRGCRSLRVLATGTARPFLSVCMNLATGLLADGDVVGAASARGAVTPNGIDASLLAEALAARARADGQCVLVAIDGMEDAVSADVRVVAGTMAALAEQGGNVLLVAAWGEEALPATWPSLRLMGVPPLSGLEVSVLASQALGVTAVPPELVRRLIGASGGMPSPLEDLVGLLPRGRRDRGLAFPVPDSVRESLLLRIEGLPTTERRVLEALALAEGDLPLDVVAAAVDVSALDAREALTSLSRDCLIASSPKGWVFRQGLTADYVRERIRPTRRALLCRRIAAALPLAPASVRLPLVFLDADEPEAAASSLLAWARPLVLAGMHEDALAALERLVESRGDALVDFGVWILYAECLAHLRPVSFVADQALARATRLAVNSEEQGEVALVGAEMALGRGETTAERTLLVRAVDFLWEALAARGGAEVASDAAADAALRSRLAHALGRFAMLLTRTGELDLAWRHGSEALAILGAAELVTPTHARAVLAEVALRRGDIVVAEQLFLEAVALSDTDWCALAGLAATLQMQGRLSEARRTLEEGIAQARIRAPAHCLAMLLVAAGHVDVRFVRSGRARERLQQALDVLQGEPHPGLDAALVVLGAALLDMAGEVQKALDLVEPALARAEARGWLLQVAELGALRDVLRARLGLGVRSEVHTDALITMGALTPLAELYLCLADRGEELGGRARAELEAWAERQPVRLLRFALLSEAPTGEATSDVQRRRAKTLLRQLVQMQDPEDQANFLLHPQRLRIHGGAASD
jgi:tetratricopeptide (TPR) repeat protein